MKSTTSVLAIVVSMMLILVVAHGQVCNPEVDIQACYPALVQDGSPSPDCCVELDQHRDCVCQYFDFRQHILPPNKRQYLSTVINACGLIFPICHQVL